MIQPLSEISYTSITGHINHYLVFHSLILELLIVSLLLHFYNNLTKVHSRIFQFTTKWGLNPK